MRGVFVNMAQIVNQGMSGKWCVQIGWLDFAQLEINVNTLSKYKNLSFQTNFSRTIKSVLDFANTGLRYLGNGLYGIKI